MHNKKLIILLSVLMLTLLCACGGEPASPQVTQMPAETPAQTEPIHKTDYTLRISELMAKNRASLADADGDFSDWIEIENYGSEPVSLLGLSLSDKKNGGSWEFPDAELAPGGFITVFASGKDRTDGELHTDFALSEKETVYLKNAYGEVISAMPCQGAESDCSLIFDENGAKLCLYPTPGADNGIESYIKAQKALTTPRGLVINEVCVYDFGNIELEFQPDWIELKNNSDKDIELEDYWLSDSAEELRRLPVGKGRLAPGALMLVYCEEDKFELASDYDRIFLSDGSGNIVDSTPLRDLQYGGSYGRMNGENGFFYFSSKSPGRDNSGGLRYVSETPKALTQDGVFNGVSSVKVELSGKGRIFYSLDGSVPEEGTEYKGPFEITETCALRAVAIENGALQSRPLTMNFILNEYHSVPVVCLDMDDFPAFNETWFSGWKSVQHAGNISFYEDGASFSANGTVKLNGETSLVLPKKNLSVRFRAALGQSELEYDLFDGGTTVFRDLLLRAGQDYYSAVIRNELCQALCLEFSDSVISQRSRFCALYVNGTYYGLYTIKDKCNGALYANMRGAEYDMVQEEEANVYADTLLYKEVLGFAQQNDLSLPENYAKICENLDIDSLIDWLIAEGLCANNDLHSGNLRYCKLLEPGEKWKLMFYDLDATFATPELIFTNVIDAMRDGQQVTQLSRALLKNESFRDRFLKRAAEALNTTFTNEHIVELIDSMCAEIEPELDRDFELYLRSRSSWENAVEQLKTMILEEDWSACAVSNLKEILKLTDEEVKYYFG